MEQACRYFFIFVLLIFSCRKLLFVNAIKQIAVQCFQLSSKGSLQAVIAASEPELYY